MGVSYRTPRLSRAPPPVRVMPNNLSCILTLNRSLAESYNEHVLKEMLSEWPKEALNPEDVDGPNGHIWMAR